MTLGRKKTQDTMYSSAKQRRSAKLKRAPTLIDKARELLRLSGVKTTLIINDEYDYDGGIHMYSNEEGSISEVLSHYVEYLNKNEPYRKIDDRNPAKTFQKKTMKPRKTFLQKMNHKKNIITNDSIMSAVDPSENDEEEIENDDFDHESMLYDLEENTNVYRKGIPV